MMPLRTSVLVFLCAAVSSYGFVRDSRCVRNVTDSSHNISRPPEVGPAIYTWGKESLVPAQRPNACNFSSILKFDAESAEVEMDNSTALPGKNLSIVGVFAKVDETDGVLTSNKPAAIILGSSGLDSFWGNAFADAWFSTTMAAVFTMALMALIIFCEVSSSLRFCVQNRSVFLPQTPSLLQYAGYYFTLGLDIYITVAFRWIRYYVLNTLARCGMISILHHPKPDQIASLFLDTSLVVYFKEVNEGPEGPIAIFHVNYVMLPSTRSSSGVLYEGPLVFKIDLEKRQAVACIVDDKAQTMATALNLAFWILVAVNHPKIHAVALSTLTLNHEQKEIHRAAVLSTGVTMAAILHGFKFLFMRTADDAVRMYNTNVKRPFPLHAFAALNGIKKYSKTVDFLLQARSVTFRILRKYKISVNYEAFFVATVVHSVDHYAAGAGAPDHVWLSEGACPDVCAPATFANSTVVQEMWSLTESTILRSSSVTWHQELYAELHKINPDLADHIHWCIGG